MLTDYALKVAESRYFMDGENWNAPVERASRTVASQEEHSRDYWATQFADAIANMYFLPAGRILRNAGRPRRSMFNCYVLPIGDYFRESLILWCEGGGVGVNISHLRPRGAKIHGVGGHSSGPVSFLIASDAIAATVESGGSRRAAALACMHVEHPDINDFITAKVIDGRLPHYNISVAVTNEFLDCVEDGDMWQLRFKEQLFGQVPTREIWEAMVAHAEPGLLNWDRLRPLFRRLVRETEGFPDWYVDSGDLTPKDHLETQVAVQKYVDGAVSKTINLPAGATPEGLSDLLVEYVRDLKGATVYVDGSREGRILERIPREEIFKYLDAPPADRQIDACGLGLCEV